MPSDNDSFLRQVSKVGDTCTSSKRWKKKNPEQSSKQQMEGLNRSENGVVMRKTVMVLVDRSTRAKHAMMWALTHVANKGDLLILLHVLPPHHSQTSNDSSSTHLANSLVSLCKACRPEVEVESLVVQGHRLPTVMSHVKKLGASVLVLGQKKPSLLNCMCRRGSEDVVEQCIMNAECLTLGVRKQSRSIGGYLISTRWHKNFWLLA